MKSAHAFYLGLLAQFLGVSCYKFNRTHSATRGNGTRIGEEGNFEFYFKLVELARTPEVDRNNSRGNVTTFASAPGEGSNSTTEDPRARIIGGEPATEGEFKHQLSIRLFRRHHCGATLVNVDGEQLAITAAHCVRDWQPVDVTLVAGDLTRSDRSGHEQERKVIDIVPHENFEFVESVPSFDIALMFIEKPFDENNFVGVIPLPKEGEEPTGKVIVSGWGDENPRYIGRASDKLMKVEVPVVDQALCKRAYSFIVDEFHDHFMCAGYMQRGIYKDSCQGDSGGPVKSADGGYLVGVVSWGAGCGIPLFPGVNTKVSYFNDWISDKVRRYRTDSSSEEDGSREEEEEEGDGDEDAI